MKKTVILLSIFSLFSCLNSEKEKYKMLASIHWIQGSWIQEVEEGTLKENWVRLNDSTLICNSVFIKKNDTIHSESMKLFQKGDALFYESITKGQHNDEPIVFNQIVNEKELVFENQKNDFPKVIRYQNKNKSLGISIAGIQQGKEVKEQYLLKKED
jgi:hypothetical protein